MLEHQLAAVIEGARDPGRPDSSREPSQPEPSAGCGWTFGRLFAHPQPPLVLLQQVKDFAKAHRDSPQSYYPRPLATLLYYASIAAALVRCGERITAMNDDQLREAFAWGLAQPWNREPLVSLLREAAAALDRA